MGCERALATDSSQHDQCLPRSPRSHTFKRVGLDPGRTADTQREWRKPGTAPRQVSRFFAKQMANKAGMTHGRIHQAGPRLMCPDPKYSHPNVYMKACSQNLASEPRTEPIPLITFSAFGGPER